MIKFSLLITTRMRVNYLSNLLLSIYNTTKVKNEIEVLVTYDNDDELTDRFVKHYKFQKDFSVYFFKKPRSINTNGDYYNWMATEHSKGEYLIVCNDDSLFMNKNWDELAWNKLEAFKLEHPDGIIYGIPEDQDNVKGRYNRNRFSCFPLFSRKCLEVLGFLFQPEYWRDGADWVISNVYRQVNRIVDLREEIIIQHISVRSGRREVDDLYREAVVLCHQCPPPPTHDVISRDIKTLQHYIDTGEILKPEFPELIQGKWKFK